jgi:hypothetical protein
MLLTSLPSTSSDVASSSFPDCDSFAFRACDSVLVRGFSVVDPCGIPYDRPLESRSDIESRASSKSNNLGASFVNLSANYCLMVGQMKKWVSALETRLARVEGAAAWTPFGAHPGAAGSVTWDPPLAPTTFGGEPGVVTASREDFGRLVGRVTKVEQRVNTQGAGQDGSGAAYGV